MGKLNIDFRGVELEIQASLVPGERESFFCPGSADQAELESVTTSGGDEVCGLLHPDYLLELQALALRRLKEQALAEQMVSRQLYLGLGAAG